MMKWYVQNIPEACLSFPSLHAARLPTCGHVTKAPLPQVRVKRCGESDLKIVSFWAKTFATYSGTFRNAEAYDML